MGMTDEAFTREFEQLTLPPEYFDHRGHLRLAWLYLRQYPLEEAIARVASGIREYASSLGATDKFQHTLTEAIVRIMAARPALATAGTLEGYLAENPDLVTDIQAVLSRYYSAGLLQSPQARSGFVDPDLEPLPAIVSPGSGENKGV